jgi:lysozyme
MQILAAIMALSTVPYQYLEDRIIEEEGLKLSTYECTMGHTTIGVGFNLDAHSAKPIIGRELVCGSTITKAEAIQLFQFILLEVLTQLNKEIPNFKELDMTYQYLLIQQTYQLGINGTKKFKGMLSAIKSNNTPLVIKSILNSRWAKQTPNRVKRLVAILKQQHL